MMLCENRQHRIPNAIVSAGLKALSLPTSLAGMDEFNLWYNRLNLNGLRHFIRPPFQGLGGLPYQNPGRWPGLGLKRAVGAEENQLYSAYFRPIEAGRRKIHSGPKKMWVKTRAESQYYDSPR
jgi:hypothetical protein